MGMTLDSRRQFGVKLAAVGAIGLSSLASAGEIRGSLSNDAENFQLMIGRRFTVASQQNSLVVQLSEVQELQQIDDGARPSSLPRRQAVSLIFSPVDLSEKLAQLYQLSHDAFGGSTITLMPVGKGNELEAVLN